MAKTDKSQEGGILSRAADVLGFGERAKRERELVKRALAAGKKAKKKGKDGRKDVPGNLEDYRQTHPNELEKVQETNTPDLTEKKRRPEDDDKLNLEQVLSEKLGEAVSDSPKAEKAGLAIGMLTKLLREGSVHPNAPVYARLGMNFQNIMDNLACALKLSCSQTQGVVSQMSITPRELMYSHIMGHDQNPNKPITEEQVKKLETAFDEIGGEILNYLHLNNVTPVLAFLLTYKEENIDDLLSELKAEPLQKSLRDSYGKLKREFSEGSTKGLTEQDLEARARELDKIDLKLKALTALRGLEHEIVLPTEGETEEDKPVRCPFNAEAARKKAQALDKRSALRNLDKAKKRVEKELKYIDSFRKTDDLDLQATMLALDPKDAGFMQAMLHGSSDTPIEIIILENFDGIEDEWDFENKVKEVYQALVESQKNARIWKRVLEGEITPEQPERPQVKTKDPVWAEMGSREQREKGVRKKAICDNLDYIAEQRERLASGKKDSSWRLMYRKLVMADPDKTLVERLLENIPVTSAPQARKRTDLARIIFDECKIIDERRLFEKITSIYGHLRAIEEDAKLWPQIWAEAKKQDRELMKKLRGVLRALPFIHAVEPLKDIFLQADADNSLFEHLTQVNWTDIPTEEQETELARIILTEINEVNRNSEVLVSVIDLIADQIEEIKDQIVELEEMEELDETDVEEVK